MLSAVIFLKEVRSFLGDHKILMARSTFKEASLLRLIGLSFLGRAEA